MSFGLLTDEMKATLQPFVEGKEVWDFGAGDLTYAEEIVKAGANKVVAIDKQRHHGPKSPRIVSRWMYFHDVGAPASGIDVAFVSWPRNMVLKGLVSLLETAKVVVYLGSNTDGNACGWKGLFEHLLSRELLAHVPHYRNTLLVCGEPVAEPRPPTLEEEASTAMEVVNWPQ